MKSAIQSNFLLTIIICSAVFWSFFHFGNRVANDFPLISNESLIERFSIPSIWTTEGAVGMGEYAVAILWGWPLNFIFGIGAKLLLNFALLERILGIIPYIVLGSFSINKLLKTLKLSRNSQLAGSVLYLLNSYILLVIDGGQLNVALAYAIFPLVFTSLTISVSTSSFRDKLFAGILVSVMGVFDIRFIYVIGIILFIYFIWEVFVNKKETIFHLIKEWIYTGAIVFTVLILSNMYWILPAIFVDAPALPTGYGSIDQVSFLSFANIGHSMMLLAPHWYENSFGKISPLLPLFYIIPIVVFLAPVLKKSKAVTLWLIVALVGIFLAKGNMPPLGNAYIFLFENIPGFSLFRDPTKFYFLVALSFSVLTAISLSELSKLRVKVAKFIPFVFIFYLLILVLPVWSGKMTGTFSSPIYEKEHEQINRVIENDNKFGRVLYIPSRSPLGYASPNHPSVEMSRMMTDRNFAIGAVGSYEIFNTLREASFIKDILSIYGISYVVYPFPDERKEDLKEENIEYYYAFSNQLSEQPFLEKISGYPVGVFKVINTKDRIFATKDTWPVLGEDRIYEDLASLEVDVSANALVFVENGNFPEHVYEKVILYDKTETDLKASLINRSKLISLADGLERSPNATGWWKRESTDLLQWRNFLQQKYGIDNLDFDYGSGWAISEGENRYIVENSHIAGDILIARVMSSNHGGEVIFSQAGNLVGSINTLENNSNVVTQFLAGYGDIADQALEYNKAEFHWHVIGNVSSSEPIEIFTKGNINVVNSLVFVSREEWSRAEAKANNINTIYWDELTEIDRKNIFENTNAKPEISYERLSPTKYLVKVSGIAKPTTIVFSETYNPLWELNGESSYPVYSSLNGFTVNSDGEYVLEFSAQRYVIYGLIVSAITFITLTCFLLYNFFSGKLKKKNKQVF